MKHSWKGILNYFLSIKNILFFIIFFSIGLLELCIGAFVAPARQVLFFQGIIFMQLGVLISTSSYIRPVLQSCMPLPVSAKTIFKVSFISIAALMGISAAVSMGIIILAGIIAPIENLYAIIFGFIIVLPVIFTVRMFCTALSAKNKISTTVISEVIFWGLFSMSTTFFYGRESFIFIPAVCKPYIYFLNTGSTTVIAVIGIIYFICILLSFLWYKLSCKNFEKAQYSNYIKYMYR